MQLPPSLFHSRQQVGASSYTETAVRSVGANARLNIYRLERLGLHVRFA
jgi:hypothetical protein